LSKKLCIGIETNDTNNKILNTTDVSFENSINLKDGDYYKK
jgi:hypothetical protein